MGDVQRGWAVFTFSVLLAIGLVTQGCGSAHRVSPGWSSQNSGTSAELRSVAFVDELHGWAVGDRTILQTADGGAHWLIQTKTNVSFHDIVVRGRQEAWAFGQELTTDGNAVVWHSDNGGSTWRLLARLIPMDLESASFLNDQLGLATGTVTYRGKHYTYLIRTRDGGVNWKFVHRFPASPPFPQVFFSADGTGWFGATGADAVYTLDGGDSWTKAPVTAGNGWIVGLNGGPAGTWGVLDLAWSQNDNRSELVHWLATKRIWEEPSTVNGILMSIAFGDESEGWAVGGVGFPNDPSWPVQSVAYKTTDGGETWLPVNLHVRQRLTSVYFVNASHGWAVGTGGIILHYSR